MTIALSPGAAGRRGPSATAHAGVTQLIINADDFGLTPGVNAAIVQLFEQEAITSASALVTAAHIEDGIAQLPRVFHERLGLHLCLDEEFPVSDPGDVPTLIDPPTGRLLSRGALIARLLQHRVAPREIYAELKAQLDRLLAFGITPDHLDGHGHIHVFPPVANIVARLMDEYGIVAVRRPAESFWPMRTIIARCQRLPLALAITRYAAHAFHTLFASRVTTAAFSGLLSSGHTNRAAIAALAAVLARSRVQSVELMCHPGVTNEEDQYRHWRYDWVAEFDAALCMRETFLRQGAFQAVSFRELQGAGRREQPTVECSRG